MSKIKEKMMMEGAGFAFPKMQQALFQDLVQNGSPNTEFSPLSPFALGGGGQKAGNNSSSPSTTRTTSSVASKPETLILNAQARRNTTTKEKKLKATPYTMAHEQGNFVNMEGPEDFETALNITNPCLDLPDFYWNEKKQALEEVMKYKFNEL